MVIDEKINRIWESIENKMDSVIERVGDKVPYTSIDGVFDDKMKDRNNIREYAWWTNGFWSGMMWLMYIATKKEQYRNKAISAEKKLQDAILQCYDILHHDVGFMYHLGSGVHAMLEGDENAKRIELLAANTLAARFNIKGNYIRAWNGSLKGPNGPDSTGWAIIDCMMNIPLLYRASAITGDYRYEAIAKAHADKTMKYHVREDGSVRHIVSYDKEDGSFIEEIGGQGYGEGSSWSRGQAWALYGFVLSYIHTKEEKYLNTAKKVAHYFISCVCKDWKVLCDFRAPKEPVIYDSTAAACAACGLIEIAKCVPEMEVDTYLSAALNLIYALDEHFSDYNLMTDSLLLYGTEAYERGRNKPIIYGDYYFIEAIYKLKEFGPLFW